MMKQIFKSSFMMVAVVALCMTLFACDKDDDEMMDSYVENVPETSSQMGITVDKKDLNFSPEKGITRTIHIECTSEWEIQDVPEWLRASSTKGMSSANVEFTTLSANKTSSELEGSFSVLLLETEEKVNVVVRQDGSAIKDCRVRPNLITTLSNGIAFDLTCDRKVARYYRGYIMASRAGVMSDDEIVKELEENFTRHLPNEDEVADFSELTANTKYIIYTIGYDKDGNRGDLTAIEVSTLPKKSNEPKGWIEDMGYDSYYWYWTVTKSATCKSYYMMSTEDPDIAIASDVLQAWWIDYAIQHDEIPEYVNGGNWKQGRNGALVAVWTRGIGSNNNPSGEIAWNYIMPSATRAAYTKKSIPAGDHSGKKLMPGQYRLYMTR